MKTFSKFIKFNKIMTAALGIGLLAVPVSGLSQVSVNIGAEPVCPYGYYDYYPYSCAPVGFWGPEFFFGGHFRGVGPWEGRGRGYDRVHGERYFGQAYHAHGSVGAQGHGDARGDRGYGGNHGEGHGGEHGGGHGGGHR